MNTIEIKPDVMEILCQRAENTGRTITDIADDMLRTLLSHAESEVPLVWKCHSCKQEVEYQINEKEGYCDNCGIVFIDKA